MSKYFLNKSDNLTHDIFEKNDRTNTNPDNKTMLINWSNLSKIPIIHKHIICLTIGFGFNKPILLSKYITHLTTREHFNQPIILPKHMICLIFGENFSQPIVLTKHITHLTFGEYFNQPVVLSKYITVITFGEYFDQSIILPKNITVLILPNYYNSVILPSYIKRLTIEKDSADIIDNLPDSIYTIGFFNYCPPHIHNVPNIPNSVNHILCCQL